MAESIESQEKRERRRRTIYADLLVDTVRRHSLLPSDLMDKMSRSALPPNHLGLNLNHHLNHGPSPS